MTATERLAESRPFAPPPLAAEPRAAQPPTDPPLRWPTRGFTVLALALAGIGVIAALAAFAVIPRRYTSTSQVLPAAADSRRPNLTGALAGLGGALGAVGDPLGSPPVVASLLGSRAVLEPVVRREFRAGAAARRRSLAEIVTDRLPRTAADYVVASAVLAGSVKSTLDARTGLITLKVELRDAQLAHDVNAALLAEADLALQRMRRQQTAERRRQTELRLATARRQLADAEEAQRGFAQRNVVATSPSLALEDRRLQRVVDLRQEVFSTLTRDYEQLLQDEARTLPALAQFLPPDLPVRKSKPSGSLLVAGGVVAAAFAAVLLTMVALLRAAPGALDGAGARQLLRAAFLGAPARRGRPS